MSVVVPNGFTREQLLACVDREIRMRELVYPERVALRKMTPAKMADELGSMRAIRAVIAQLPPTQPNLFGGGKRA